MADFLGDSSADKSTYEPETSNKLKYELSKQALGLNGDIRLAFKSDGSQSCKKSDSNTVFALHESLLDDEFDDVIGGPTKPESGAKLKEEFVQSSKPLITQSKDINEINRIWNEKKKSMNVNEQLQNTNAQDGFIEKVIEAPAKSLAEQIATSRGAMAYQYGPREQLESESGGYNSKAKMAVEMSLGLQNSTFISTHETTVSTSDEMSPAEKEVKRLQELRDLRAITTNHDVTEKASSCAAESENASHSGDAKEKVVTPSRCEEAVTENLSIEDSEETPVTTSNGARMKDPELCSVPEMMALFSDPGLSFLDIEPVVPMTGWKSVKRFLFGPPKLNRTLVRERDTIFALAKMPLDNTSKLHISMLETVYLKLVGTNQKFERYGIHWTQIGFQGSDPSTDLRSCGMLGLLQLALIILEHNHLISRLFSLSHHETANFPLAVLSINFTKICLGVLRNEKMNKLCNAQKQVIGPFNDLFVATWYHFDDLWNEESTISDIAYMLKDLENMIIENINNFLNFAKKLQSLSAANEHINDQKPPPSKGATSEKEKNKLSRYAVGYESESNIGPSNDNQSCEFLDIKGEKSSSNAEFDFVGIADMPGN